MKHILCAFWDPVEALIDELFHLGREHNWQIELCGKRVPPGWFGDGVITDYLSISELSRIRNFKTTPIVARQYYKEENIRVVIGNTRLLAKMITDYFVSKGFRNFAAVDARMWPGRYKNGIWIDPIMAWDEELRRRNLSLNICHWNPGQGALEFTDYGRIIEALRRFFQTLPRPTALFVAHGYYLAVVYRALESLGIKVPEEVAVLCNTSNSQIAENAAIPTSWVSGELRVFGRQMAQLMQLLLAGKPWPHDEPIPVTPAAIISHQSTDTLAVPDAKLARAISFLLQNYMNFISIRDAAQTAGISPCMLHRLFRKYLDKSPIQFLQELRMNQICNLLDSTEQPVEEIARKTGYGSGMSLSLAFKRIHGIPPGVYRRARRESRVQ